MNVWMNEYMLKKRTQTLLKKFKLAIESRMYYVLENLVKADKILLSIYY